MGLTDRFGGAIGAAHQGAGFDVAETHGLALAAQLGELIGRDGMDGDAVHADGIGAAAAGGYRTVYRRGK